MQPICYTKHRLGAICQKYGASEVRSSLDHCPVSLCHSFSLFPLFPFFPFSLSPSPHNLLSLPISLPRMRCEAHCTNSGLRTSLDKQFFLQTVLRGGFEARTQLSAKQAPLFVFASIRCRRLQNV